MCSSCTPLDTPRRPQVGDLLDVPVGYETVVEQVHEHGVRVDVWDRLGRDFSVARAPHGRWTRLARISGRAGRGPCVDQWRQARVPDPALPAVP